MNVLHVTSDAQSLISLDRIGVSFPVYHGGSRSLKKSLLFRSSAGRIARDANQRILIEALRDVTVNLKSGDRLALIGSNGAGKTTLLRVMAGIYEPTSGYATIQGRISPMFDIGLGIDNDLSGYENIRLRGMILGLTAKQIETQIADIASFTDLGDYLDMPVRTYSSGMMLRLTFAVATCFEPEIILMDEWVLAGDNAFFARAARRLHSFLGKASVLVLASHNLALCQEWCTHGLWLDQGRSRAFGPIDEIVDSYTQSTFSGSMETHLADEAPIQAAAEQGIAI